MGVPIKRFCMPGYAVAKAALKRLECPYAINDNRGNLVMNLCFKRRMCASGLEQEDGLCD